MIRAIDLEKKYTVGENVIKAVDKITYTFEKGKFYSIVGRSGSGKSTFLSLIGTLQGADGGIIEIDGINVNALSENKKAALRNKKVGFVFQNFCLEQTFTCGENVVLPLIAAKYDRKKRKEQVSKALKWVGLEDRSDQKVSKLSGGEKQRVAIARALINDPEIILADEPTGNLDSENGKTIISILRAIVSEGKTVIMVTHNSEDAKKADVILHFSDGKIIEETSNNEL